jgi:DNA replication protein DnaC
MSTKIENLICDIHGTYVEKEFYGRRCPTCGEEYRESRDRQTAAEDARARLNATHIPALFRGKLLEDFKADTPAQQKVLRVAKDYAWNFPRHYDDGRGLIMMGNIGTGKTMLSCAIVQNLVGTEFPTPRKQGEYERSGFFYTALYATATEVIWAVRDTWGSREESMMDGIKRFVRPKLLVLDEVGADTGTDSERSLLLKLVDARYGAKHPTIVVTNRDPGGLTAVLGANAVDRLRDHEADVCVFNWESYRKWKQ